MSKKKYRNIRAGNVKEEIVRSLKSDFFLNDEEVELIEQALEGKAPVEIAEHIQAIHEGKVPLPAHRPTFHIEMENHEVLSFSLSNHLIILLHDFIVKQYGLDFGSIYWGALIECDARTFQKMLVLYKKAPFFAESIENLRKRTESEGKA